MSEHRRKPPNGGRAGGGGGRRRAPSGGGYGSAAAGGEYGGRAAARRTAGGGGGGRRRAPSGPDGYTGSRSGGYGGGGGRSGGGGYGDDDYGRGSRRRYQPPAKKRFIDYPRSDRDGLKRWLPSWKQVLGMCVLGTACLIGLVGIGLSMVVVPDIAKTASAQSNVYYWSDGTQLGTSQSEYNRQIVELGAISADMQNAVITAENATFYEDSGIDPKGMARAVFNMAKGDSIQGGSTITQQYVKNAQLDNQAQTLKRKAQELLISVRVGATESKETILAGYLNTANYGRGAYGIQAAAQTYFGIDASKLNPHQSAFLASLLNGPGLFDPQAYGADKARNTERATERTQWILKRMTEVKVKGSYPLTPAEAAKYKGLPKMKKYIPGAGLSGQLGYMAEMAKAEAITKLKEQGVSEDQFNRGGYEIHTTFDKKRVDDLKKAVEEAEKKHLNPKKRSEDKYLQVGGASVDAKTGRVLAIYGGPGFENGWYLNNARNGNTPVGSTWKPFTLAAAMEYGTYKTDGEGISPESVYSGANDLLIRKNNGDTVPGPPENDPFRQRNEGRASYREITLDKAMQKSVNSTYVQLGWDIGHKTVEKVTNGLGLPGVGKYSEHNASWFLGTSTPDAVTMASAYTTFTQGGEHRAAYSVTQVKKSGAALPGFDKPKPKQVISENVANNVTKVLNNVVKTGTASKMTSEFGWDPNRPAAGKTGTTDGNASAWFVGYTPQLSTSIVLSRPLNDDIRKKDPAILEQLSKDFPSHLSMRGVAGDPSVHGGDLPTEIWTNYMEHALKGTKIEPFAPALPIDNKIYGGGAKKPEPKPVQTPEDKKPEPSERPKPGKSDGGGGTCPDPLDPACWGTTTTGQDGGDTTTTTDGGTLGGITPTPTPDPTPTAPDGGLTSTGGDTTTTGGGGNGSNKGGLFGGG
ncbi:transglycosylase domain-containing protein [Streptomyces polyrhachis]|uniref:Transglycosylase domain-containing protein n=1 Tax=Streptomyces polyrhachis TaxID=1282885 RepID=A0ABW2GBJ0_9ACTN